MTKRKILVIDDEKGFADMLKEVLETTGKYVVEIENDPRKGLIKAVSFGPDLVLIDMIMPGMNGQELAERLKKYWKCDIPIIFVSGFFTFSKERIVGSETLLPKPLRIRGLLENLDKCLPCVRH